VLDVGTRLAEHEAALAKRLPRGRVGRAMVHGWRIADRQLGAESPLLESRARRSVARRIPERDSEGT